MNIKIEGRIKVEVYTKDGVLKDSSGWIKNIITNAGKAQIALLAGDATAIPFTFLAVGTSNTAVAATDTTLTAEVSTSGLARAAGTVSRVTTTVTNDTLQVTFTWTASGTVAIEEIGLFNAASVGTMLGHALTTTKTVNNTDVFIGTYQVKFA